MVDNMLSQLFCVSLVLVVRRNTLERLLLMRNVLEPTRSGKASFVLLGLAS